MTIVKNAETNAKTLDQQLLDALLNSNIPRVRLEADENGHAFVNKDAHADIYEWAVNG